MYAAAGCPTSRPLSGGSSMSGRRTSTGTAARCRPSRCWTPRRYLTVAGFCPDSSTRTAMSGSAPPVPLTSTKRSPRPRRNVTSVPCCYATVDRRSTPAALTTTMTCPASSGPGVTWPDPRGTAADSPSNSRTSLGCRTPPRRRAAAATAGSSSSAAGYTAGIADGVIDMMVDLGPPLVRTRINLETFAGIADGAAKYPAYAAHMRDLYAASRPRFAAAREAGVPIYAGTDAGSMVVHGRIADEVDALKEIGMTATDALGAACWDARQWLGRPVLEHGASADLICFADDPRAGAGALDRPDVVILRGRVFAG